MVEPTLFPLKKKANPSDQDEGGGGGGMDPWQVSVENRLQSIDNRLGRIEDKGDRHSERLNDKMDAQFYITWAGLIAGVIILTGIMAVGFEWI